MALLSASHLHRTFIPRRLQRHRGRGEVLGRPRSFIDTNRRMKPTDTQRKHDLGVLFVHGIGDQPQASTLVEFGTPLVRWLKSRAAASQESGSVEVVSALLTPGGDQPACSEIRIEREGSARSWLLAEAWWAEAFSVPRFRDLARWSISVVPWTFGTHFGRRLWRAWHAPADGLHSWVLWMLRVLGAFVALLGGIILSLLMLVVLSALLLLGLIPWQRLRNAILRLQMRLASSIGDSYILVGRPLEGAAILTRFRRDLGWLSSRCRRVAVVGHSQGGAVATLGVDSVPETQVELLFTFGSGLRKLQELADLQESREFRRGSLLTMLGLLLTAFSALTVPRMIPELFSGSFPIWELWWVPVYAAAGVALLAAGIGDFVGGPEPGRLLALVRRLQHRGLVWHDAYAGADPVSNGRLHDDATLPPVSVEVANRGSMLADHTSYWQNQDGFVATVADALLKCDDPPVLSPLGETGLAYLSARRRLRVRILQTIGWIGVASVVALLVRYRADWTSVVAWTTTAAADYLASIFGGNVARAALPESDAWGRSIGWLSLIAVTRLILGALWNRLDELENEKPPPYRYSGPMRAVVGMGIGFQVLFLLIALQNGGLERWLMPVILLVGVMLAVAFEVLQPKMPEALREGMALVAVPPRRTRAEKAGKAIWNLVAIVSFLVGAPLALVSFVRWTRGVLAQVFAVPEVSWTWAVIAAATIFLAFIFLLRGVAALLVRRKALREVPIELGDS